MISLLVVAAGAALQPCSAPIVIDGDTIVCGREHVRLAAIDAPELPGHCRVGRACVDGNGYASKAALTKLLTLGRVSIRRCGIDRYGRTLAHVYVRGQDVGAAMVEGGAAVDRYPDPCL